MLNRSSIPATAQFVHIKAIKDSVIIMKNGTLRSVVVVSSVNFALKSQEEQDAIIGRYQQFLNSLDFPLQLLVHSRKLNIDNYLEEIKGVERQQDNELLRVQISEYHDFIKSLVDTSDIMNKVFYVVVPYAAGEDARKRGVVAALSPKQLFGDSAKRFNQLRSQLFQRVDFVIGNLRAMDMRAAPLNSQELIELLYSLYNPEKKERKKFANVADLDIETE